MAAESADLNNTERIEQLLRELESCVDASLTLAPQHVARLGRAIEALGFSTGARRAPTAHPQPHQRLVFSDRRLVIALEAARMGMWERNLETGEDYWSEQQEGLFGFEPGEFVGTHIAFMDMVHPDDRAVIERAAQLARDGLAPYYRSEYRIFRRDGQLRWMSGRGDVLRDGDGKPIRMIGITLDITDRKLAEQERLELLHREQRARAEAEAANRRKDQFLAVLSHELRTPLTPVLARLPLLQRDPGLTPMMRNGLEMIRRNVELEARLIDDMLDLTKVARGELHLHPMTVDVEEKIREAMDIFQAEFRSRRLTITLELSAAEHHVEGDPTRLQQIFWNLISNAVKFTPEGGSLAVRTENTANHHLLVHVEDTGVGMDPEVLPRVFDAFEQGEQTLTRRYGGLGLGLSITRALVEKHGGTITALSEGKDRGSMFTVELPTVGAPPKIRVSPPRGVRRSQRVLLVEDNQDTLRSLARLLSHQGYRVLTAESIASTLALAETNEFDVVISDIGLPDGTGWELMRQLRARRPVKGIALSGFASIDDVQKSVDAGFSLHLAKPVTPDELDLAIREVTAGTMPQGSGEPADLRR